MVTVTFRMNTGDIAPENREVRAGTALGAGNFPSNPARIGYAFLEWNTLTDGTGDAFNAGTEVDDNMTVYAQWDELPPVTVTFMKNDGTATVWATPTAVSGAAIAAGDFPANPARDGWYAFAGWNTQENGTGTVFDGSTTVSAAITVYAQWMEVPPDLAAVTFRRNDGTENVWKLVTVVLGDTANQLLAPTRVGYAFGGWNTAFDGSGSPFDGYSSTVAGDITVYAQWNPRTYTVTFRNNYTESDNATYTAKSITVPAETIGESEFPANPTREGWVFAGWNSARDGTGAQLTASTAVHSDRIVYAQWTVETDYVTFRLNDGTEALLVVDQVNFGDAIGEAVFPHNPSRNGYAFTGWNTSAGGGGSSFTASTVVHGSITVYAQWTGNTYTVTFNRNGGNSDASPTTKTVTVPATTVDSLPSAPGWGGYTFTGWNTQAKGLGDVFTASTVVSGNITVYAQWTGNTYTVTFDKNGGNTEANPTTKSVTVPATTVVDLPAPPTRTSYTFVGWNTNAGGGGTTFTASTVVSASITVHAQWQLTYTVSFDVNGGNALTPNTRSVAAGAAVGTLPEPTWANHQFDGWYSSTSGGTQYTAASTITGNITMHAHWTTLYTGSFNVNGGNALTPNTRTVAAGAAVGTLPEPTRTNYYLYGWYSSTSGGTLYTAAGTVTGNITMYAQWTIGWVAGTFAGNFNGSADGTGTAAQFNQPYSAAMDGAGNLYVADNGNDRIRKITPAGVVTTLAGSSPGYADGTGTAAQFNYLQGVAVNSAGTIIYAADSDNNRIRKITSAGVVSPCAGRGTAGYADGTGTAAQFNSPQGMAVDGAGNVYVADSNNHRIRKITPDGVVTTLAGSSQGYADGAGTAAQFNRPYGVAVDGSGSVYVADSQNHRIRKVTPAGVVTTLAGSSAGYADGTGAVARFSSLYGITVNSAGTTVYAVDSGNNRIRKVTPP
jgi:uncharacterized repeat protein (TIGR02543 family)